MIRVVVDHLASVDTDAVVRPATVLLQPASQQSEQLDAADGCPAWEPLPDTRPLDVGAAVVTAGGGLPAEFVVHVVVHSAMKPVTADRVRLAVTGILQRAADWGFSRVATPLLGVGPEALTVRDAASIWVQALRNPGTGTFPKEVCIVVESEEDRAVVAALLEPSAAT